MVIPQLRSLAALAVFAATLVACQDRRPDVPTAALVETASATPSACFDPTTVPVDTAASAVRWKGTKFAGRGKHEGTVRVSDGSVRVCDDSLVGGAFTIDMESIAVTDIPAHEPVPRERLTNHLRSDDFFAVEAYPTARLEITRPSSQRSPIPLASRGRSLSAARPARSRSAPTSRSSPLRPFAPRPGSASTANCGASPSRAPN